MKRILLFWLSWTILQAGVAQEKVLRSIAGNVLSDATYDFVDRETGKVFEELSAETYSPSVAIRSPYNTWHYWNGVLNIAMLKLADYFEDEAYREFAQKNYAFAFAHSDFFGERMPAGVNRWQYPFGLKISTTELDDCGAMGGGLIEVYREDPRPAYRAYLDQTATHMLEKQDRLADGTLVRAFPHEMTLWADDLYMSIVFLARMGDLTGEQRYFDDAAKQVLRFHHYLYNPYTQLHYHCWYSDLQRNGVAHWGRCNGWMMLAQADLLDYLPADHPQRDTLISLLEKQITGIARYQHPSGLWHQLLDKTDSYLETSCTAMFTYAIARAVNQGWLDPRYGSIATEGWRGILSQVQADGQVAQICVGTGIEEHLRFYYERPTKLNDIHGLGAVLLAGLEVLRMEEE